jgi:hypothetical protein
MMTGLRATDVFYQEFELRAYACGFMVPCKCILFDEFGANALSHTRSVERSSRTQAVISAPRAAN